MSGNFNQLQTNLSQLDINGTENTTAHATVNNVLTISSNNNNTGNIDLSSCSLNQSAEYQWFNEDIGLTIGNEDTTTHRNGIYEDSRFESSGVSYGEKIASISGSILDELGFNSDDSTSSPLSISLLKSSELLYFSPINTSAEEPGPPVNPSSEKAKSSKCNSFQISVFSTDSLDNLKTDDLYTTKRNNYTLTFEDGVNCSLIESMRESEDSKGSNSSGNNNQHRKTVKLFDLERKNAKQPQRRKCYASNSVRSIEIQTSTEDSLINAPSSDKTILVCYPNYTLPDLGFLQNDKESSNNVVFVPQKIKKRETGEYKDSANSSKEVKYRQKSNNAGNRKRRPMSCNDVEQLLKSSDLSHIQDWQSLNFLLPKEFQEIIKGSKFASGAEIENRPTTVPSYQKQVTMRNEKLQKKQLLFSKNKRYSLQETNSRRITLPEIQEITNEINENLKDLDTDACSFDGINVDKNSRILMDDSEKSLISNREKLIHYNTPNRMSSASNFNSNSSSAVRYNEVLLEEKQVLIDSITSTLSKFHKKLSTLTSPIVSSSTSIGKLIHESLCPALYELISDGLCPFLDTIFGKIPNTVWRVVEASVQYGPTSQTLNELIMRINSEELLVDGPMKFNSFITGLLNLSSLPSWLYYLRSKDLLLRTHYERTGFLYLCNTTARTQFDMFLTQISSLNAVHFELDIFHDAKILHWNLNKMDERKLGNLEKNSKKVINSRVKKSNSRGTTVNSSMMKRSISDERPRTAANTGGANYSNAGGHVLPKSKTSLNIHNEQQKTNNRISKYANALNRPKTLVYNSKDSKEIGNFKKLQMKWELLASTTITGDNEGIVQKSPNVKSPIGAFGGCNLIGSKIPRPIVTSPVGHYQHKS